MPGGQRELVDVAVGAGGVDVAAIRVGGRAGGGDLGGALIAADPGGHVLPELGAGAGVQRDRLAVGGGDHDHVTPASADLDRVQLDRRGIDRPVEIDLAQAQIAEVVD